MKTSTLPWKQPKCWFQADWQFLMFTYPVQFVMKQRLISVCVAHHIIDEIFSDWKKLSLLPEWLVLLHIVGPIGAPVEPLNAVVQWCMGGLGGSLNWTTIGAARRSLEQLYTWSRSYSSPARKIFARILNC